MADVNQEARRQRRVTEALDSIRALRAEVELSYRNVGDLLDVLERRVRVFGDEGEAPQ